MSPSQSAITQRGWGVPHTLRGGIDPGDLRFRPRVVGVVNIWKYCKSGDETLSSPGVTGPRRCPERKRSPRAGSMSLSQIATSQLGWGFHTLRGGIDPGDLRFLPRVVGGVDIWKVFNLGMWPYPPRGVAGPRRCPERQLSPRAGSMSLSQLTTSQFDWGFHIFRGGIDPGDLRFVPGLLEV